MLGIIDSHLHIWDLKRFSLPWLDGVLPLKRTFSYENYVNDAGQGKDWKIEQAVYVEVDVARQQREEEAVFIESLCSKGETRIKAAIVCADLGCANAGEPLEKYKNSLFIRGVRHILHVPESPKGACLQPRFVENVRLLGELGMIFEGCVRCEELGDLASLASQCPGTPVVLNHMGIVDAGVIAKTAPTPKEAAYRDLWFENIGDLAALPNVVCKISGLGLDQEQDINVLSPALERCFDAFGQERIMFGTNYPVCQLSLAANPWIEALLTLTEKKGAAFQKKLFTENAGRIYDL